VNRIASWFPDATERRRYQAAAANFRLPYWDFAATPPPGEHVFLDEFTTPGIAVYGPAGWQEIANPLYSYHFHPIDKSAFIHAGVSLVGAHTFSNDLLTELTRTLISSTSGTRQNEHHRALLGPMRCRTMSLLLPPWTKPCPAYSSGCTPCLATIPTLTRSATNDGANTPTRPEAHTTRARAYTTRYT